MGYMGSGNLPERSMEWKGQGEIDSPCRAFSIKWVTTKLDIILWRSPCLTKVRSARRDLLLGRAKRLPAMVKPSHLHVLRGPSRRSPAGSKGKSALSKDHDSIGVTV